MVALERVLKNVLSGVGEVSVGKILAAGPLMEMDVDSVISVAKARASVKKLVEFLRGVKPTDNPGEVVKSIVKKFDFETLLNDGTPSFEERMQNLEVLANTASEYENLEDFLADAALMSSSDEKTRKNSVTLMTLHAAKGLEFPVVFVVGLEEGLFPSSRSFDTEADLEEERRLMYVGMTRAMDRLFLTFARQRRSYGMMNFEMPSRFLTELGYKDKNGDGFLDKSPVGSLGYDSDGFPEDLPVWE
jgi:DNA helicase-2/ATP-dependent DNA helicase PcrA